eukprot:3143105-Pyramimonas_sp.AAC.1
MTPRTDRQDPRFIQTAGTPDDLCQNSNLIGLLRGHAPALPKLRSEPLHSSRSHDPKTSSGLLQLDGQTDGPESCRKLST